MCDKCLPCAAAAHCCSRFWCSSWWTEFIITYKMCVLYSIVLQHLGDDNSALREKSVYYTTSGITVSQPPPLFMHIIIHLYNEWGGRQWCWCWCGWLVGGGGDGDASGDGGGGVKSMGWEKVIEKYRSKMWWRTLQYPKRPTPVFHYVVLNGKKLTRPHHGVMLQNTIPFKFHKTWVIINNNCKLFAAVVYRHRGGTTPTTTTMMHP